MRVIVTTVFVVLCLLVAGPGLAESVPFGTQQVIGVEADQPRSIAVGDLDGDGDPDLVSASSVDAVLTWYENLGGENFDSGQTLATGPDYTTVIVADVDGDGDLDVIAGADGDETMEWYENTDGAGTFDPNGNGISSGADGTTQIVAADFDGDGNTDVASATNGALPRIQLHMNTGGDGGFPSDVLVADEDAGFLSIFPADLDGDGDMDIVSGGEGIPPLGSGLAWWENEGAGSWVGHGIASLSPIVSVAAADVNVDGRLDVIAATESGVVWLSNEPEAGATSSSSSTFPTTRFIVATETIHSAVHTADVDGDGDPDVMAASIDGIVLYENTDGAGYFDSGRWITTHVDGDGAVATADVDGDGDLDFFSAYRGDDKIAVYENRQIHRSALFPEETFIGDNAAATVFAADLDRDGDPDLVSTDFVSGTQLTWYRNQGGSFSFEELVAFTGDLGAVDVGDLDRDGNLDIVSGSGTSQGGEVAWHPNTFGSGPTGLNNISPPFFQNYEMVRTADVDGDGDLDVLSASDLFPSAIGGDDANVIWWENDGSPESGWTGHPMGLVRDVARAVVPSDLDRDGRLDVIVGAVDDDGPESGEVTWFRNVDGTAFQLQPTISSPNGVSSIAAADLDGDGDEDVLSASAFEVAWHENRLNEPSTDFGPARVITTQISDGRWVAAADLDGDGDQDVLSASFNDSKIAWYENEDGLGSFGDQQIMAIADYGVAELTVADIDGDGDLDVAIAANDSGLGGSLSWFRNEGGQFALGTSDLTPAVSFDGQLVPLLGFSMTLNARPGDTVAELATLDIGFAEGGEDPLDSAEANALIERLLIYRDDGTSRFEAHRDVLVETIEPLVLDPEGFHTLVLPDDDPNLAVAAPATFFVVAELTEDASGQSPNRFEVIHATAGSSAQTAPTDAPLTQERPAQSWFTSTRTKVEPVLDVDSFVDEPDQTPGDGTCTTVGGTCTLRAAVQEANARPGDDLIIVPANANSYDLTEPGASEDLAVTGDLDITDVTGSVTIRGEGPGLSIIDGKGLDRVFQLRDGATARFEGLTIRGGDVAAGAGGGIQVFDNAVLTLENCEVRDNSAGTVGGGIHAGVNGTVEVLRSTIANNTAGIHGAGLATESSSVTIRDSTISANTAPLGAAFYNEASSSTITSTTISGNTTSGGNGAVAQGPTEGAEISVTHCTVTANDGGGLANSGSASMSVDNTIVASNPDGADVAGAFASGGHNLIGDVGSATGFDPILGDLSGLIPLVAPLADNGGPTLSHALLPGSPALDAGLCSTEFEDQRGVPRPVDLPGVNDGVTDGCDIGAYEADLATALVPLEIPVRWCAVAGAKSIEDPGAVGADSVDDVLRDRLERVNKNIYGPQAGIRFRSGATESVVNFPVLPDPVAIGAPGDVFVEPETANFDEFLALIAACRAEWELLDPTVIGVTAVHINHFVDANGVELPILGLGGRAAWLSADDQVTAGRLMVSDNWYRLNANPPDQFDQILGHELGHSISLEHGDGVDNDGNLVVDDDDDRFDGLPKFDGPGLMQYRNGIFLSLEQIERARSHAFVTIPDSTVNLSGVLTDNGVIDPGIGRVLDFGFGRVLDFSVDDVQEFGLSRVLDFGFSRVLDFGLGRVLDFGFSRVLDFGFGKVLDFGMVYGQGVDTGSATLVSTTNGVLWPSPIRPNTSYVYYLDVDNNDGTGAVPSDLGFPGEGVAVEVGVDLIVQVDVSSSCTTDACVDTETTTVFRFIDAATGYVEDPDAVIGTPLVKPLTLGLVVDNGGEDIEIDDQKMAMVVQAKISAGTLVEAGAMIGVPIAMETLAIVDCTTVLPGGIPIDCQCNNCEDCDDYPGCAETGQPLDVAEEIITDCVIGEVTFDPPELPECTVAPSTAGPGDLATISTANFPDGALLQLFVGDDEIPAGPPFIGNTFITIPPNTTAAGLDFTVETQDPEDNAQVAFCVVTINSNVCGDSDNDTCDDCSIVPFPGDIANDGADFDQDGLCDAGDPDDDDDGRNDAEDPNDHDHFVCGHTDADACDDCTSGIFDPDNDGPTGNVELDDSDGDGLCDAGDRDDDGDDVDDLVDPEPEIPEVCGIDADEDGCDDCTDTGSPNPLEDGPDADQDGICADGDSNDNDPLACSDVDADDCDDCSGGLFDPNNDGIDQDNDGTCDVSDDCTDLDGDGLGNGNLDNAGCVDPTTDSNDTDPNACADTNGNGCDDCSSGTFDPGNDGIDEDSDGLCDGIDNCPHVSNPGQEDLDEDGLGDVCDSDADGDGVEVPADCDDAASDTFPGADEALCDGIDQNCNGVDDDDKNDDGDPVTYCDGDCDDDNGNNYPGNSESCDGLDNDCNDNPDDPFTDLGNACGVGECAGGTVECTTDGAGTQCSTQPGGSNDQSGAELCDGLDNNCDGTPDEPFTDIGDGCGLGECAGGEVECTTDGAATQCSTQPGGSNDQSGTELCDGLDNNCDGTPDEPFTDIGDGCGLGECAGGEVECTTDGAATQCSTQPGGSNDQSGTELCDGLDNNCDGTPDEPFTDIGDGCGLGECAGGEVECTTDGAGTRCSTQPGGSNDQSGTELCDGLDNNCDGTPDEPFTDIGDGCGLGECAGGEVECTTDGTGTRCSTQPGGSNDQSGTELCDGLDNNCDGTPDEPFTDIGDGCGLGECAGGAVECTTDGAGTQCSTQPGGSNDQSGAELCDGLDNNCNGTPDGPFTILGDSCGVGECAGGTFECATDGTGTYCSTGPGGSDDQSGPEVCDGRDNDCDGLRDETYPDLGDPCGLGICAGGRRECTADGTGTQCSTLPGGSDDQTAAEICDGNDNDCNGETDEPFTGLGDSCGVGVCSGGAIECALDGAATQCSTESGGTDDQSGTELCDGLDNDCNGFDDFGQPGTPGEDPDADYICGGSDNCPDVYNPTQEDQDHDGIGDACDPFDDDETDDETDDDESVDLVTTGTSGGPEQLEFDPAAFDSSYQPDAEPARSGRRPPRSIREPRNGTRGTEGEEPVSRDLRTLADPSAPDDVRDSARDALVGALAEDHEAGTRLEIVRGILGQVDTSSRPLLIKHLEGILNEAEWYGQGDLAREAALLLKTIEESEKEQEEERPVSSTRSRR